MFSRFQIVFVASFIDLMTLQKIEFIARAPQVMITVHKHEKWRNHVCQMCVYNTRRIAVQRVSQCDHVCFRNNDNNVFIL